MSAAPADISLDTSQLEYLNGVEKLNIPLASTAKTTLHREILASVVRCVSLIG